MRPLLSILFCLFYLSQNAQQYQYKIDLLNIEDDKVKVQLKAPAIKETEILFSFPKVIPGSYSEKSYGRFIENFQAFDSNNNPLKAKKANTNQYLIKGANTLSRIEYLVNDTWDERDKKQHIFEPGGSNIDAGKNIVVNNFAFFGYFEGYKLLPFEIEVTHLNNFYGATALPKQIINSTTDLIKANGFVQLADNPVLYSLPDTISFKAADTKINVAVYSATGKVKSAQVVDYLKPMANALEKFFTKLPVDAYQFLFFFDDGENPVRGKEQDGGYGALEHNYCSFYYLPEIAYEPRLKSMISDVSSHEFLHILTPLNIHSEQIENFDFVNPEMSQHLWLYEGVTEYFSNLVQLQSGIITEEKFISEMRGKINEAEEYGDFSMTEMSKRVLEDKFQKKYNSVYNRGALMAFLLDLTIIEKTHGEKNLKSLMVALSQKYGKNKPFADNKLFEDIISLTHPDIKLFIDSYIAGDEPLPYESVLSTIGYHYQKEKRADVYFAGRMGVLFDDKDNSFKFSKVEKNALDIKDGDIILKINGNTVTQQNIEPLIEEYIFDNNSHPFIKLTVKRDGEVMELAGNLYEGYKTLKNFIDKSTSTTAAEGFNKSIWVDKK